MKILHFIPTYAPAWKFGGPVRSVSTLCEGLAARGHEVTVLTTDAGLQPGDIAATGQGVLRDGVKVYYFPQVTGYGIKSPALEAAVGKFAKGQDLVHVTAIWQRTGPAACRAARHAGVPYVISSRGALGPYSWRRGTIKKLAYYFSYERRNLSEAAGFHYTSAMEAVECERFRFGKPACTVPNGIDFSRWQRDENAGRQWRERHGIGPRENVLLYAGRLHHKKGLDLLPAVLAGLKEHSWRMVFVGPDDDGTRGRLEGEFRRNALTGQILFLSAVSPAELVAVYSGANVFVLPSLHENFGNVAVEAAACGCRILASEHTGVARELAEIGAGECLPRTPDAWVQAINQPPAGADRNATGDSLRRMFGLEYTVVGMQQFYHSIVG